MDKYSPVLDTKEKKKYLFVRERRWNCATFARLMAFKKNVTARMSTVCGRAHPSGYSFALIPNAGLLNGTNVKQSAKSLVKTFTIILETGDSGRRIVCTRLTTR
jgi:transposase